MKPDREPPAKFVLRAPEIGDEVLVVIALDDVRESEVAPAVVTKVWAQTGVRWIVDYVLQHGPRESSARHIAYLHSSRAAAEQYLRLIAAQVSSSEARPEALREMSRLGMQAFPVCGEFGQVGCAMPPPQRGWSGGPW